MAKSMLYTLFVGSLYLLASCGNSTSSLDKGAPEKKEKHRISSVEISQFQKVTTLQMKYSKDGTVNITIQPFNGNADARLEFNRQNQIREIISGASRIQYVYGESDRKIGLFADQGQSQIMFEYEGDLIVAQHTIVGNDTVGTCRYTYKEKVPVGVEVIGRDNYFRSYSLSYFDTKNPFSNFYEMILPTELSGLLGIPAIYAENYLQSAKRNDVKANEQETLKESYIPSPKEILFEIESSGKQETLKYVTDGSRQWSATIRW